MAAVVRLARPGDMMALLRLYQELHPNDVSPPSEAESLQKYLEAIAAVDIFVAEEQGELVSTAMLAVVPNLTRGMKPFGVVENVVTAVDHRQKGVGRRVVAHLIEQAWGKGCYKIMVFSKQSPEANALYRGLGFKRGEKIGLTLRFKPDDSRTM